MPRADSHAREPDYPAGGRRHAVTDALIVDCDIGSDWPVTELELAAIERLLGDDLARILRGTDPN